MKHTRAFILAFSFLTFAPCSVVADDWPQWRGPERDGKSSEKGLLKQWPDDGPPLAWSIEGVGGGYSSIAIADKNIFTLGDLEDGCYAIALSESDGSQIWKTKLGAAGGHRGYPGPRSTPTVDGDQVFVLNQHGDLACLNTADGNLLWSVNLEDDFGGKMMSGWRYSESPLVDGKQVIVTPGGKQGAVLALDRSNGEKIWQTGDWTDPAGYSSVIIANILGTRQYVQLTGRSVAGLVPETGEVLWRAERQGKTAVITTPVVNGDVVFVTSAYGVGCNGFKISKDGDSWATEELYANKNIANHHGGVLLLDGHVFGSSGGTFCCLEIDSGDLAFKGRSVGKGATTFADGHLYLRSEAGPIALIEATTEGLVEKGRFDQPQRSGRKAWAHPVVAGGKLYLRDQDVLLCYDISE
ncbi:MAG: PQQ-binding-like beta-propeller repeat protein [Planctomycetota bacterium]